VQPAVSSAGFFIAPDTMPIRHHRLILVTGGTRSGKSRFAVHLAKRFGQRVSYIATCRAMDREMRERIAAHQRQRPKPWTTIEPPIDPTEALARLNGKRNVNGIIVDCLTMYVSELVMRGDSDRVIQRKVRRLCQAIRRCSCPVVVVTNEVGSSIVPAYAVGRRFRDLAGMANQIAAGFADQVFLLIAGIPLQVKGGQPTLKRARAADETVACRCDD
jgi:adenosylcobinamide kinase/adenosylcobinamide-phosphate guanylyltransferase